jgi:hypothetical protein
MSLRLWPGVLIVLLQWLIRFGVPPLFPDAVVVGLMAGMGGGLAVVLWWVLFSRAPWPERLGAVGLMAAAFFATRPFLDKSIATAAMGVLFPMLAIPVASLAFVAWAVATQRMSNAVRRVTMAATIFAAFGAWALARTGGFSGDFEVDLAWRWSATPEERLLAEISSKPAPSATPPPVETRQQNPAAKTAVAPAALKATSTAPGIRAEWSGFRGPRRDGIISGARFKTDWSASPPAEMWRRPVGPGWSSVAVQGDLIYTQEQRGPDEVVACYRLSTGEPVWTHRDAARFWEANGGPGPRGTPTLSNGLVCSFGATGIVNVLNAADGSVVWTRNAASDAESKTPTWGFASSPLVLDDLVIVAASGRLVAYDLATGAPRWLGPQGGASYSSPHLATIDGVAQILLLNREGAISVSPADGKLLWEHHWAGYPIVQPAVTPDGGVLISIDDKSGMRRLSVTRGPGGWNAVERWTSIGLKPYFNDFVIHKGHAFGFDGGILACIGLEDGKRKWKGGRYGHGQLVLLAEQDLLLVLSEQGDLALVGARPEGYTEHARIPAIEGKTWNHPALAGNVLLVRNGEEMVAFRMTMAR